MQTANVAVLVVAALGAACDSLEMTIFANDSGVPVHVTLTNPHPTFDGRNVACRDGDYDEPRAMRLSSAGARSVRDGDWPAIAGLIHDAEACSYEFVVEPGFTALLDSSSRCDQSGDIEGLVIETMSRKIELRGPELRERFRRRSGLCVLALRDL